MLRLVLSAAVFSLLLSSSPSQAREYYIGGPVTQHDMEIVGNYLTGIEMAPMLPGMVHGPDVIHVEADIHATADNPNGFPDGAWVPYLTVGYTIEKLGSSFRATGTLKPMVAKDGPHYADDVKMDGAGQYRITYDIKPPKGESFYRHVDKETGVPEWWQPFSQSFTFTYPQK